MVLLAFSYALSQGARITEHKLLRKQGPGERVRWSQSVQDAQIQVLHRLPTQHVLPGLQEAAVGVFEEGVKSIRPLPRGI